jgi:multidrug efflux system outer membrane protein
MRNKAALVILPLMLMGCDSISHYWHPEKTQSAPVAQTNQWWKQFNDPLLDQLAEQLLAQNIDIKIAQARVDEARGQVRVASSSWFPDISLTGNAKRGTDQVFLTKPRTIASGGFDATWEIDIFGATRTRVASSESLEVAANATMQDVQNSVIAELARTVIEWHQARQTIKETNDLLASQEDQVGLLNSRAKAGLIDASFKERAQAEYAQTATQLPLAQAAADAAEYKIEKLLGKAAGELFVMLTTQPSKELNIPAAEKTLELTLESIRLRPDIRAAKAQMLAAQSNLGAAEADLWPRITIGGFFGAQGNSSQIPSADNPIWSLSSGIAAPLLNFGKLRGAVDSADARAQQSALSYENATLAALQEAKTALSDYLNGINAVTRQSEALSHRRDAVRLAKKRFLRGLTDMTDLTTAQAELDQATLALINQKAATAIAFIRLQKAMGAAFK